MAMNWARTRRSDYKFQTTCIVLRLGGKMITLCNRISLNEKKKKKTLGLRNIHLYNVLNTMANFKTW